MKIALGKISTGSKIFIDEVKAKNANGSIISVPGITLKIGTASTATKIDQGKENNENCVPFLLVGKFKDGTTVTKRELNSIDQLFAYSSCGIKYIYQIISYEVNATINNKPLLLKYSSDAFPLEIKEQFRGMKSQTV